MKKILILLAVLAALIVTAVVYQKQQNATLNTAATSGARASRETRFCMERVAMTNPRLTLAKATRAVHTSTARRRSGLRSAYFFVSVKWCDFGWQASWSWVASAT